MRTVEESSYPPRTSPGRRTAVRITLSLGLLLLVLLVCGFIAGRLWLRHALRDSLPQVEGSLQVPGLHAPVSVVRDAHGVPHITAASLDDLVFAQGYITAQDRLWQMDMLRRHGGGQLAEVLGSGLVKHDRTQRYLQLRESAERDTALLPAEQRHYLDVYAAGVNAEMARAVRTRTLPAEFRVLGYQPTPWSAADSLVIGLVMAEDLSTSYPDKLNREAVAARLDGELVADLYPATTWRDRPPAEGKPDLTAPREMLDVPLDETQARRTTESDETLARRTTESDETLARLGSAEHAGDLARERAILAASIPGLRCPSCGSGSNNWVVSGARSASGKPLLANDMHLSLTAPGIWYTADLESGGFHVSGVTLPGTPFVIVGHNDHVAWGFTNSYADVQDLYVEQVDGDNFVGADGASHPLHHQHETIRVKHGSDVSFDVLETEHGGALTPILTPLYPHEARPLALRWTVYDSGATSFPFYRVNAAASGAELVEALRSFAVPSQNLVYADDAGHIGYHLLGVVPLRGDAQGRSGISPVPVRSGSYEWAGRIGYDQLPSVVDPPGGILATANARITPDSYPYQVSLDWALPYRNERIWKALGNRTGLTADSMLALQDDLFSALDKTVAERISYAVDHSPSPGKRARAAADLLRGWDGRITRDAVAPNITESTREALLDMVLEPHLGDGVALYTGHERTYVVEEMLEHQPARWLPSEFHQWNDLVVAALERGLKDAHAPSDLAKWSWGSTHRLNLRHPVFGDTAALRLLLGEPTGTGPQPLQGSALTVRASFGVHGQSERFVTDLADPEHAVMTLPMGESGNVTSPWFMDQFPDWYGGRALRLPFHTGDGESHTLTLEP